MGGAGAAVVAVFFLAAALVGLTLTVLAWRGTRGSSGPLLYSRYLLPAGVVVLGLGTLLPKSTLRELAFETTGRVALALLSVVGAACAGAALRRREPGAARALLTHAYFGLAAGTPLGEALFGVFQMM
jgi:hypothetical protein